MVDDLRGCAVALAKLGFRVFKLKPNGKTPIAPEFYDTASSDPARVAQMWTDPVSGESTDHNIGVLTGGDLVVLDVDTKDGKQGLKSLETLAELGLSTDTLTAITPSGGRHLFYRVPADSGIRNSAGHLGKGLDVRGHHGYVVGVGSVTPQGEYDWFEAGAAIAELPEFAIRMCRKVRPVVEIQQVHLSQAAQTDAERRATEWLRDSAPEAIEGQGGNTTTFRVAAKVKDFGVDESRAVDLLLDHWNEEKAIPPWQPDDLQRIVENAYKYSSSPQGVASAEAEFEAVDLAITPNAPAPKPTKGLFAVSYSDAISRALEKRTEPLVKGLLDKGALSVLYGDSNTGKTFVAYDLSLKIGSGLPWAGHRVSPGLVVYVAAEGGAGGYKRIRAWHDKHKPKAEPKFKLIPCPIDLRTDQGDAKALVSLIRGCEKECGEKVTLVVIDTLSRALSGGDENSSVDMGGFIKNIDALRAALGAHILIIHHTGKDAARGMRGWSGMRAAIDTEIEVADRTLRVTKQRDMEPLPDMRFALEPVRMGQDEDGDPITTCTVVLRDGVEAAARIELTPIERKMYEHLVAAVIERAGAEGVPPEQWYFDGSLIRELFVSEGSESSETSGETSSFVKMPKATAYRHLSHLSQKGWLKKTRRDQWVILDSLIVSRSLNEVSGAPAT